MEGRFATHRYLLNKGKHHAVGLQRAWAKYGKAAFTFTILEVVEDPNDLTPREQHWIDTLCAHSDGYNCLAFARSPLGHRHSPETRKKMSLAKLGKPGPGIGRTLSEETRQKISAAMAGRKRKPEDVQRSRETRAGYRHSEETKRKMSEARLLFFAARKGEVA